MRSTPMIDDTALAPRLPPHAQPRVQPGGGPHPR
jgi:hypothetical protein